MFVLSVVGLVQQSQSSLNPPLNILWSIRDKFDSRSGHIGVDPWRSKDNRSFGTICQSILCARGLLIYMLLSFWVDNDWWGRWEDGCLSWELWPWRWVEPRQSQSWREGRQQQQQLWCDDGRSSQMLCRPPSPTPLTASTASQPQLAAPPPASPGPASPPCHSTRKPSPVQLGAFAVTHVSITGCNTTQYSKLQKRWTQNCSFLPPPSS